MTHEEWISHVLDGFPITDVGQLEKRTRTKLNRMAKAGTLIRTKSWVYPKPATLWFLA